MNDDKTLPLGSPEGEPTLSVPGSGMPSDLEIGTEIGAYRLTALLGAGGMGEVFAADQTEPIKRRVALKVIKTGMDTKAVIARFEAERQALAMMDHPAIARVYEAGATERGRPYFAMEYVDGEPVTTYCDKRRLSTQDRLELFIRICEAVQHAHQKAVIHRDLKPSNILVTEVDGRPQPKIIDFGVAKATEQSLTDETMVTAIGQLLGTPEYMSPEQAEGSGDVDTRTDVYALGVVLYELLSGTLPFPTTELRKAGLTEIHRIIREQDPPRPSARVSSLGGDADKVASRRRQPLRQLQQNLRGDLDWITMKALAKERERRYDTANGLAMDIRRFLNDEQVLATPPSPAYRLGKLVRRNRGVFAALASLLAVLTVATTVSLSLYFRAERESQRARTEAAKSTEVSNFLKDMLAGVGPAAALGRDTTILQEILAETDQRMAENLGDQPEVEADLRTVLAITSLDIGDYETALAQAQRNVDLLDDLYGHDDHRTAAGVGLLGRISMFTGDLAAADSMMAWADSLISAQVGPAAPDALSARATRTEVLSYIGDVDRGADLAVDVLDHVRGTAEWGKDASLTALFSLAQIRTEQQRYAEADSLYEILVPLLSSSVGAEHPNTLTARTSQALALTYGDEYAKAEEIAVATLADLRRILGDDHRQTQIAVNNLAILYSRMDRNDEAEALYRESVEVGLRTLGPMHPEQLAGEVNFATFLSRIGHTTDALEQLDSVIPRLTEAMGPDYMGLAYAYRTKGGCLRELGRLTEAVPAIEESRRIFTVVYGETDERARLAAAALAEIHTELGNADAAAIWRERS